MTLTIESVKAKLIAKLANAPGDLIILSDAALVQARELADVLKDITNYDATKVTQEDLEIADLFVSSFNNSFITGEIVNGVLVAQDAEVHRQALEAVKKTPTHDGGNYFVAAFILTEVLQEQKQFRR